MTKEQYEALPLKGRIDALVHVIKSFSYFATATVLPLPEGGYSLSYKVEDSRRATACFRDSRAFDAYVKRKMGMADFLERIEDHDPE